MSSDVRHSRRLKSPTTGLLYRSCHSLSGEAQVRLVQGGSQSGELVEAVDFEWKSTLGNCQIPTAPKRSCPCCPCLKPEPWRLKPMMAPSIGERAGHSAQITRMLVFSSPMLEFEHKS